MRIAPINIAQYSSPKVSFGDIDYDFDSFRRYRGVSDSFERSDSPINSHDRSDTLNYFIERLDSIGVKAKIRNDNFLEISKFNPNWYSKLVSSEDNLPADLVFKYTKKFRGSVNFAQLGVTDLGEIISLEGTFGQRARFDFSGSKIKNFGRLRRIEGDMIVDKNQFDNFKFEGLKVSGDIIIANHYGSRTEYKKLKPEDKDMLLHGFTLLHY